MLSAKRGHREGKRPGSRDNGCVVAEGDVILLSDQQGNISIQVVPLALSNGPNGDGSESLDLMTNNATYTVTQRC